jgi:hypothetical protein
MSTYIMVDAYTHIQEGRSMSANWEAGKEAWVQTEKDAEYLSLN